MKSRSWNGVGFYIWCLRTELETITLELESRVWAKMSSVAGWGQVSFKMAMSTRSDGCDLVHYSESLLKLLLSLVAHAVLTFEDLFCLWKFSTWLGFSGTCIHVSLAHYQHSSQVCYAQVWLFASVIRMTGSTLTRVYPNVCHWVLISPQLCKPSTWW